MTQAPASRPHFSWALGKQYRPGAGRIADAENEKAAEPFGAAAFCIWWRIRDSNPGPADYDSACDAVSY